MTPKIHSRPSWSRFRSSIGPRRVICLDIPDDYEFMDPDLVRLLKVRMARYLPMVTDGKD